MKYVGIDIGDGESAVTVVSENGSIIPAVVPLGNTRSIRSIVGKLKGKTVIGDQVVLNHAVSYRSARFKSKFLLDENAREDLRLFANGLYELVRKSLHDDELRIALGTPAQWQPADRQRYAAIVESAGFFNIYTVSESRAAFLYAHYSNELNLSADQLKCPTLVIDIGSSTLDYAYIVDGKERDMGVFGNNHLGGGILDALILEEAVSTSPDAGEIRSIFEKSPSWRSYCELIARKLKEEYFLTEEKWVENTCSTIAPIYYDPNHCIALKISLNAAIMKKLLDKSLPELEGVSFRKALQGSLERARRITAEKPIELMIVTGGASRMGFFRELCGMVFPNADLALCEEPEFSIARGLGIAARTDDMLSKFRAEINEYFASGAIALEVERRLPQLLPDYIRIVSELMQKKAVVEAMLSFEGNPFNKAQVFGYVNGMVDKLVQDRKKMEEADMVINKWIGQWLGEVQNRLDTICDKYHIDRADMSLVKIHAEVELPEVKLPAIMSLLISLNKFPKFIKMIAGLGSGWTKRKIQRDLTAMLSDPNGEFARELGEKIADNLQRQIDDQTKKVEIQIGA